MNPPEYDVFADEKDKRKHEEVMATTKQRDKEDMRESRERFLIGLAIVVVILGIVGAIFAGVSHNDEVNGRTRIEHEKTAQACIEKNYVWINDGCIPLTSTR